MVLYTATKLPGVYRYTFSCSRSVTKCSCKIHQSKCLTLKHDRVFIHISQIQLFNRTVMLHQKLLVTIEQRRPITCVHTENVTDFCEKARSMCLRNLTLQATIFVWGWNEWLLFVTSLGNLVLTLINTLLFRQSSGNLTSSLINALYIVISWETLDRRKKYTCTRLSLVAHHLISVNDYHCSQGDHFFIYPWNLEQEILW